jgi:hypothetical protein
MRRRGLARIMSFDRGFDAVDGIERIGSQWRPRPQRSTEPGAAASRCLGRHPVLTAPDPTGIDCR